MGSGIQARHDALTGVVGVLFDFDGPLCHLFATTPAKYVANELRAFIGREGLPPVTSVPPEKWDSPLDILKGALTEWGDAEAVKQLELHLTEWEHSAVAGAKETDGAAQLVEALWSAGIPMAITTNNSVTAVRRHLDNCGMIYAFEGSIHGRLAGKGAPLRLKPDPDCIERALAGIGPVDRESVLMIGDSPDDVAAAESAAVRFLGFQNPDGNTGLQDAYPGLPLVHRLGDLVRGLA